MKNVHVVRSMMAAVAIVTAYVIYKNNELSSTRAQEKIDKVAEWMELQAVASSQDAIDIMLMDTAGGIFSLTDIANNSIRMGIYINRMQCSECWKKVVHNLNEAARAFNMFQPFIVAEGFSFRDIRIISKEDSLGIPLYLLQEHNNKDLHRLSTLQKNYFFFLHRDSTISSIFFYDDVMMPMISGYLRNLSKVGISTDTLEIPHRVINLGVIPYRRKIPLKYILRNNGAKECNIIKIQPSCNCTVVKDGDRTIGPNGEIVIEVDFVSDTWGQIERAIEVYTDQRHEPYILYVTGYCE